MKHLSENAGLNDRRTLMVTIEKIINATFFSSSQEKIPLFLNLYPEKTSFSHEDRRNKIFSMKGNYKFIAGRSNVKKWLQELYSNRNNENPDQCSEI